MFKQATIHYPTEETALRQIYKELAVFRCTAAVKYIESLNLNDRQIEVLYVVLAEDMKAGQRQSI